MVSLVCACASGPDTGVRSDFEQQQITSVAIAPFYARGNFGMTSEQLQAIQAEYETVAIEALREQGFEVIDSDTLQEHLVDLELWDDYEDGIHLRQPLTAYFENSPGSRSDSIEIQTLRTLAESDAFPVETLLFGEVIYHSEGTCRAEAPDFNPYARLTVQSSAPTNLPRPCISSHFQAKLVDVHTGKTMWFNRMFSETHAGQIDSEIAVRTITQVVMATLNEDDGVTPLAPRNAAHAESH